MLPLQNKNYQEILDLVNGQIMNLKPDTIEGQTFLNTFYEKFTNSITPLTDVSSLIKSIDGTDLLTKDASIKKTVLFIKRLLTQNNSLNYQVNLAREEHLREMQSIGVQNPFASLESIKDEFEQPDSILKILLEGGTFDILHSKHLQNIKNQMNIFTINDENNLNGYDAIVMRITDGLRTAQASTDKGQKLLDSSYKELLESATPMLVVKQFVTNAQQVAADDVKLKEVINFAKKNSVGTNLNYLVNLCKEEHFENLYRSGIQNPQETIKDIEGLLKLPSADIADYIKRGAFDNLKSNLLHEIKASLNSDSSAKQPQKKPNLNESNYSVSYNGLVQYSPIGFVADDDKHGRVMLVECDVLSFNPQQNEFSQIEDFQPNETQQRLSDAIQNLDYNPETEEFSLNESWNDFNMKFSTKDNKIFVKKLNEDDSSFQELSKEHLKNFLTESIVHYKQTVPGFNNESNLIKDADRFVMLVENANSLVKFTNIKTIRNLNESTNKYAMVHLDDMRPNLLSMGHGKSQLFESFNQLVTGLNQHINLDCTKLFEDSLVGEMQLNQNKDIEKNKLIEEQKNLNAEIVRVDNLLKIVEEGSPAYAKLVDERKMYSDNLDKIISSLSQYV